jgi:hypothetical protein
MVLEKPLVKWRVRVISQGLDLKSEPTRRILHVDDGRRLAFVLALDDQDLEALPRHMVPLFEARIDLDSVAGGG